MLSDTVDEKAVFNIARRIDSLDARNDYLRDACGADTRLLERITTLLATYDQNHSFLESPAFEFDTHGEESGLEQSGAHIGPYRLVKPIGEGGMGTVFLAEQSHPVQRQVALKVIKPGMDTRQVVARFDVERQALAMMDHPNIARVLDAGATQAGRPYFVMELVQGIPLTEYCDRSKLTLVSRLNLFLPICQAVQHAHQKGIIHRDLKPSNILVSLTDDKPVPKVIDFGLAKALHQPLTDGSLNTAHSLLLGTPLYMSPEQAQHHNLDVDTRTDIYSLGVILYELLTGSTPIERAQLNAVAQSEIARLIKELDPPKPSVRLSALENLPAVAAQRGLGPQQLRNVTAGDLDWIVMKALEKERSRRYETAIGLAQDIERYLHDEPVEACPPSTAYVLRKFIRRHRTGMLTAAAFLVLLASAAIVSTIFAYRASKAEFDSRQNELKAISEEGKARVAATVAATQSQLAQDNERQAKRAEADTRAWSEFLMNHVLATARPLDQPGGLGIDVTVTNALQRAEDKLDQIFQGQPRAEAAARYAIGVTWRNQSRFPQAEMNLKRAVKLWQRELGPLARETLVAQHSLGELEADLGRYQEAGDLLRETLTRMKKTLGVEHPETVETMYDLASAEFSAGNREEARTLLTAVWQLRKAGAGREQPDQITQYNLSWAGHGTAKLDQSLAAREDIARITEQARGSTSPEFLVCKNNLAVACMQEGKWSRAVDLWEETLQQQQFEPGFDHPDTLTTLANLGWAYRYGREHDRALPLLDAAWTLRKQKLGAEHPSTLTSMLHLGIEYVDRGELPRGLALLQGALRISQTHLGPAHIDTAHCLATLAWANIQNKQLSGAIALGEQALELLEPQLGPGHPEVLGHRYFIAGAHHAAGNNDQYVKVSEQALQASEAKWGRDHPQTLTCMHHLAEAYDAIGDTSRSITLWKEVIERRTNKFGAADSRTQNSIQGMSRARLVQELSTLTAARDASQRAVEELPQDPDKRWELFTAQEKLIVALRALGRVRDASTESQQAIAILERLSTEARDNIAYRVRLASTYCSHSALLYMTADAEQTMRAADRAIQLVQPLYEASPDDELRTIFRKAYCKRARGYDRLSSQVPANSAATLAQCSADWLQAIKLSKPYELDELDHPYGKSFARMKQFDEANRIFLEGLRRREAAVRIAGTSAREAKWQMTTYEWECASAFYSRKIYDRAAEWYGRVADTLNEVDRESTSRDVRQRLRNAHHLRAMIFELQTKHTAAVAEWEREIDLTPPSGLAEVHALRAISLARAGSVNEAVAKVSELAGHPYWAPQLRYYFATVYAIASQRDSARKEEYLSRAIDLMQVAVDGGWHDVRSLVIEKNLRELSEKYEFRAMMTQVIQSRVSQMRVGLGSDSVKWRGALMQHADVLLRLSAWSAAEELLREAVAIGVKISPDDWTTFALRSRLGTSLAGQRKFDVAEPLLLEAYAGLQQRSQSLSAPEKSEIPDAIARVHDLYSAWGKSEEAEAWQKKLEQARYRELSRPAELER